MGVGNRKRKLDPDALLPLAFAFRISVSGFRGLGGMSERFVDQARHFDAFLYPFVQHELNNRRESRLQPAGKFRLHEARRMLQSVHAKLLLFGRPHYGHVDLGMLKITRNLGPCHRDSLHARVAQLKQNGLAGNLPNGFSDPS